MAVYSYEGFGSGGTKETGRIDAATDTIAYEILASRGITAFSLTTDLKLNNQRPWYNREITFGSGLLPLKEQASVVRFMAVLYRSNLTTLDVLNVIQGVSTNARVRSNFESVANRVADGENIAQAFSSEAQIFSPVFYSFIKISDRANEMPALLQDLAEQFETQSKNQNKVMSALIYPLILVIAAVALTLLVVLHLVPSLRPIFDSLETEPSANIRLLLGANDLLRAHWLLILSVAFGVTVTFTWFLSSSTMRNARNRMVIRLPLIGSLSFDLTLSQLCRSCHLLLDMGEPLSEAMHASATALNNGSRLSQTWHKAATAIEQGETASSVFSKDARMPKFFNELFRVGEASNQLSGALKAIAQTLSENADQKSTRMIGLLTPVLTLVMGAAIGGLIYTIMTAITEVNEIAF
jgi:general secretion pathway protein F